MVRLNRRFKEKVMKKHIMAIGIIALIGASQAYADPSSSNNDTYTGSVDATCLFEAPTKIAGNRTTLSSGATASTATVTLDGLAFDTTALYRPGTAATLRFAGYCNYAHKVSLQTTNGNLKNVTSSNNAVFGSLPFITSLDYNATVNWDGSSVVLNANGVASKKTNYVNDGGDIAGAYRGNADLVFSVVPPSNAATVPMQAGTYTDVLKLQIGAPL